MKQINYILKNNFQKCHLYRWYNSAKKEELRKMPSIKLVKFYSDVDLIILDKEKIHCRNAMGLLAKYSENRYINSKSVDLELTLRQKWNI